MKCLFCKIVKKEIQAEIVYEDKEILAFKDIEPKAPVHLLIIPKKHIPSINHLFKRSEEREMNKVQRTGKEDRELIGNLFLVAQKLAREFKIDKTGYRLIFNVGRDAGQTIDHLHLHLMGGKKLPWA